MGQLREFGMGRRLNPAKPRTRTCVIHIDAIEVLLIRNVMNTMYFLKAGVAKLVDAPDLGSGAARRGGSSPSTRTT